ncbi:hypothetical protein [Mesorhizobium sp. LjNodule214]|uniref:hypothetical protein n=1 Tax=Mesorhizobium sp. LjNodule214 TaxID=3342252 RepID=UPI003ECEDED2
MRKVHGQHKRRQSMSNFNSINGFVYRALVLGSLLATSGCQYFMSGGLFSFNSSQTGSAALVSVKPYPKIQNRPVARPISKVRMNPYLGAAAHICSPSGFGQQSHCFMRVQSQTPAENI